MKTIFLQILFLVLIANNTNAQIFVNSSATGINDGTSWQDAYTTLHDALENYNANDTIWVSAGTYLPQMPSAWTGADKNTFYIYQDVKLYGGFNGTETTLDERDPVANVTILSGDLDGDDVTDDFDNNRADNVKNVMYIDTMVTTATIIDGFTIMGGHADGDFNVLITNDVGAGIWSYGSPQISNCRFTQNYALNAGGGLFLFGTSSVEAIVDNCVFERNKSGSAGGGMIIQSSIPLGLVQVSNCQFIDNIADYIGGAFGIRSSLVEMTNCQFTGNNSQSAGGAIMYLNIEEGDNELTLIDCIFDNNTSNHGGAFYHDSNGLGNDKLVFANCEFTNNQAVESPDYIYPDAGALGFQYSGGNPTNDSIIISDCTFQGNSAERAGGGIAFFNSFGTDNYFEVNNTQFLDNTSDGYGGGFFLGNYGANNPGFKIIDCLFEENTAFGGGGLEVEYYNQSSGDIIIQNTDFLNNTSGNEGAGMNFTLYNQAGGNILIEDALFSGNVNDATGNAEEGAGGFSLNNFGSGIADIEILSSIFENNSSADGAGAVQLYKTGATSTDVVKIENCLLNNNTGGSYGSGVGLLGKIDLTINSSTIVENNADAVTIGLGTLEIQNTILFNPGANNLDAAGEMVTSLGGNLIGDTTMNAFLNNTDQSEADPLFETGTFFLSQNSPAVDAGFLPDEVPDFDLAGNDRVQGGCLDIGAYESAYDAGASCVTNVKEVLLDNSVLEISPNPTSHELQVSIDNKWQGELRVQIVNTLGQVVRSTFYEKFETKVFYKMDVAKLPHGAYRILISNGKEMVIQSFVKI